MAKFGVGWGTEMIDVLGCEGTGYYCLKDNNTVSVCDGSLFITHAKKIDGVPKVTKVIKNEPATIIIWSDGTKTVVKAQNEPYDLEKGIALCYMKKVLGNKGNFNDTLRKLIKDSQVD